MIIDSKDLNRIIKEETENFVEKVYERHPLLMKDKISKLRKDDILKEIKELDKEFILDNISPQLVYQIYKKNNEKRLNEQQTELAPDRGDGSAAIANILIQCTQFYTKINPMLNLEVLKVLGQNGKQVITNALQSVSALSDLASTVEQRKKQ